MAVSSEPKNPFASKLPGIAGLSLVIDTTSCTGIFTDKGGRARQLDYDFTKEGGRWGLAIVADDGSACSFEECLPPNRHFWFATGLVVHTLRQGIASHMYALARDLLAPAGASITPSANLFPEGVQLWGKLDPQVKFKELPNMPGYFEAE